jgi:hypothetical protein
MAQVYGKKTSDGLPKALECSDDGALKYIAEIKTAAEGLATQTTVAAILAKILTAPSTEAKQDLIKTAIDAITTKLSADPATAAGVAALLSGIVLATGEHHVGQVGGHESIVVGILTRPADTPGAYSTDDEINTSTSSPTYITFTDVARVVGGGGTLMACMKRVNNVAATAQLRLYLYNAAPTPCNDHATFTQLWADRAKEIGYIDFPSPNIAGTGSDMACAQVSAINIPFKCAEASKNLYGRVRTIAAGAAPNASQVYEFTLRSQVD